MIQEFTWYERIGRAEADLWLRWFEKNFVLKNFSYTFKAFEIFETNTYLSDWVQK